jgi:hypothetical protein
MKWEKRMEKNGNVSVHFLRASRWLARDGWKRVGLQFDDAERQFEKSWDSIYSEFANKPQEAPIAAAKLIESQPLAIGLVLAMARSDSSNLFGRFKRFVESILVSTEKLSGYPATRGIPHAQAGFFYMTAAVMAMHWESWSLFEKLINAKLEWYYQSGRAIFSYALEMPYFFHSEAFERDATKVHDFYRQELGKPQMLEVTHLDGDKLMDAYLQTQMIMSLKVAQLNEDGKVARIWPDFGRFYSHRVVRVIDRAYEDVEFGAGLLRAFGEDRDKFFSRLNARLQVIQSTFFEGGRYFYESLGSWEPRGAHA